MSKSQRAFQRCSWQVCHIDGAAAIFTRPFGAQSVEFRLESPEIGSLEHRKDNLYQHEFIRPFKGSLYLRLIENPILRFEIEG
jgi:hypothetical protein